MPRIAGIDFSLTSCGIAVATHWPDGRVSMEADVVLSKGSTKATIPDRHARLSKLAHEVLDLACAGFPPQLAVIEGPSFGSVGGGQFDRYAGWWFVVAGLVRRDIPVAVVPPASLKLAVAGSGKADKAAMASAVTRLWPQVEITTSDLSDAIGLAHVGAVRLGWPVTVLERHKQIKAEWPLFSAAEEVA